jgi:hypothetical protein
MTVCGSMARFGFLTFDQGYFFLDKINPITALGMKNNGNSHVIQVTFTADFPRQNHDLFPH